MNENNRKDTLINNIPLVRKFKSKKNIENKECDEVKQPDKNNTKLECFKKDTVIFSLVFIYLLPILYLFSTSFCFFPSKSNLEILIFSVYFGINLSTLFSRIILCLIDVKGFLENFLCILTIISMLSVSLLFVPYLFFKLNFIKGFTVFIVISITSFNIFIIIILFLENKITRLFILFYSFAHLLIDSSVFNILNSLFIVITIFLEAIVTNIWEETPFCFNVIFYVNTYVLYYIIKNQKIVEIFISLHI